MESEIVNNLDLDLGLDVPDVDLYTTIQPLDFNEAFFEMPLSQSSDEGIQSVFSGSPSSSSRTSESEETLKLSNKG